MLLIVQTNKYGAVNIEDGGELSKQSNIKDLKNYIIKNILTPSKDQNYFNLFFEGRSPANGEIIGDLISDDKNIFHCYIRSAIPTGTTQPQMETEINSPTTQTTSNSNQIYFYTLL